MKSKMLLTSLSEVRDEFVEDSEVEVAAASVKRFGWVKWAAVAACLVLAALIAIPAIMNSQAQAEDIPDESAPAEAFITEEARNIITQVLTSPYYDRVSEDELDRVTLGLPIAVYDLYLDDDGAYYLASHVCAQIYPIYVDGALKYLCDGFGQCEPYSVSHVSFEGGEPYIDEPLHYEVSDTHQELYDRLSAGNAGSLALLYATDGTYLYDGSTFERVCDIGNSLPFGYDTMFDENGNYIEWTDPSMEPPKKTNPAALEGAELPDALIAEIRLTDTSVTEPLT